MSVKKEANGRRSVQVEVEVPGTPEQVWQAIATGPGVSAWFVPTEVDGRVGGTVTPTSERAWTPMPPSPNGTRRIAS